MNPTDQIANLVHMVCPLLDLWALAYVYWYDPPYLAFDQTHILSLSQDYRGFHPLIFWLGISLDHWDLFGSLVWFLGDRFRVDLFI